MSIPEGLATEVKPLLGFPISHYFPSPFSAVFLTLQYIINQWVESTCHYAGTTVRWMVTSGQYRKETRPPLERRMKNTADCGHTTKWVWGPVLLLNTQLESDSPCHSKVTRHKGLKHVQGSGTTVPTRTRQSGWSHLWALCCGIWCCSFPLASQDWSFIFSLLRVHFFSSNIYLLAPAEDMAMNRSNVVPLFRCLSGKD